MCVCARLLGSVKIVVVFCVFIFFLIPLCTRFFLFMQLMSAYDTATLVAAAVYIVFGYSFICTKYHLAGDLNTIFRLVIFSVPFLSLYVCSQEVTSIHHL